MTLATYHVIKVTRLPATATLPSRTKLFSERYKQSITFSHHTQEYDQCRDTIQAAVLYLKNAGWRGGIVGVAEGDGCSYIITDLFKPLI